VKIKLRTGGSTGKVDRSECAKLPEGDGVYWNIAKTDEGDTTVKLPVKYRYRSPAVMEFHLPRQRKAEAVAMIWLQHLTDDEVTDINVPIWRSSNLERLTQNYITEDNVKSTPGYEDVEEIGRLQFRAKFTAGLDASHAPFVTDDESREVMETWEACLAEGVRSKRVSKELPESIQQLHEKSLVEGRDMLKRAPSEVRRKWQSRDGTDWSGAFGEDPAQQIKNGDEGENGGDDNNDDDDSSSESDLGVHEFSNSDSGTVNGQASAHESSKDRKKSLHRKHRGLLQWRKIRQGIFLRDEMHYALDGVRRKLTGGLSGREPGVETEL
jgi:hypothetical protein